MKNCKLNTKLLFIKFVKKNFLMKTCFKFWFILLAVFSCKNEKKAKMKRNIIILWYLNIFAKLYLEIKIKKEKLSAQFALWRLKTANFALLFVGDCREWAIYKKIIFLISPYLKCRFLLINNGQSGAAEKHQTIVFLYSPMYIFSIFFNYIK